MSESPRTDNQEEHPDHEPGDSAEVKVQAAPNDHPLAENDEVVENDHPLADADDAFPEERDRPEGSGV